MRRHIFTLPIVLSVFLVSCSSSTTRLPGGLALEEHILSQAPSSESYSFQPVDGTQEEIIAKHADERDEVAPLEYSLVDDNPALSVPWGRDELVAVLLTDADSFQQTIQLSNHDDVIFTTSAGMPSPVMPLQGLWTYGRHWALEILYTTPKVWAGQIFIDGDLINQDKNYEEAFGFQLLSGKPFFFYQRDGKIGISYDGQEADLGYTSIPHYLCCAESVLNPIPAKNMVALFAQRGEDWYYVELGTFK